MNLHEAATQFAAAVDRLDRAGYAVYWDDTDERFRVILKSDQMGLDYVEVGNPHGHWEVTCESAHASGKTADVTVPREAFDGLVKVALHVSGGKGAAFLPGTPYPDPTARRALGMLDDAGLLTKEAR